MNKIKSQFLRINMKDVRRALGLSVSTSLLYLFGLMMVGDIPNQETLSQTLSVFVGTFGTYIVKNYFTNSSDEFLKKEES